MSTLMKMALAAFAGLLLGGGALALGQNGADDGLTTIETTTVEQSGDVSGPCDEAEHANDPRCNGEQRQEEDGDSNNVDDGDISGPCDEAEHANDPRCTGAGGDRVDNSGPGSANSGPGNAHDDDDGDREDNSGPGNAHEDSSGPGNAHDEDDDDDHSGSGHSGSGSSGSGSSGSGHSGGSDDD